MSGQWEGGKGDKPRKVNQAIYAENYDRIFGNKKNVKKNDGTGVTNNSEKGEKDDKTNQK